MQQRLVRYSLIVALLAIGLVPLVHADEPSGPVTKGVVLTVVKMDTKDHMVTLESNDGQTFQMSSYEVALSKGMKVGSKVECEMINEGPPNQVQNCELWKEKS